MPAPTLPPSQAMNLAEAVQFNEGAIVSRTLLNRPAGTVTLFAFDQAQELSEHTAPFDALVHVVEGEAVITIGGQPHALHAGQMILMPADVPHAVRAATAFKMILTMVRAA